jgi:predicted Zn-dependent protease
MDKVDTVVTWNADYNPRAGLTEYNYIGGKLFKADINFHLKTFDNKLYDPTSIYKISLHELGHLLGITGHSKNPHDIMFPTITTAIKPSARDIATLSALYSQKAEITNPANMTLAEFREAHKDLLAKAMMEALQHF